jgi:hypothetical protein
MLLKVVVYPTEGWLVDSALVNAAANTTVHQLTFTSKHCLSLNHVTFTHWRASDDRLPIATADTRNRLLERADVHDVDRAKNSYCKALGWSLEEISPGGFPYWPIAAGDVNVDGLFHMVDPRFARAPERWVRSISPLIQLMGE